MTQTHTQSSAGSFGAYLRYLRQRAQLTQRELATAVGYSESQISRLEKNQRLPDPHIIKTVFVPVLHLDDEPAKTDHLLALAADTRQPVAPVPAIESPLMINRLPRPLTSMIDRRAELADLHTLLTNADVRLLTLIGPPGIGKTRLSLQLAASLQSQFADGVHYIGMAALNDPQLLPTALAQSLGIPLREQSPLETVRATLRERHLLLVLDNLEQIIAAAPLLADLLQSAPRVKALVTSRTPLRISGEHLYPVPPLQFPASHQATLADSANYPAVQLFVERVRAVQPSFMLAEHNVAAVVEICTCLDGLPLALELAAARTKLFPVPILLERLRSPAGPRALDVLVDGPRDVPTHQQTLRGTIDWSYALLTPDEQHGLIHLGVFVGGCTSTAAAAVGATTLGNTEDRLLTLADQSLVKLEHSRTGTPRWSLLEMIREYALEQLQHHAALHPARSRHANYYVALVQTAIQADAADQDAAFDDLHTELPNLRAALDWLAVHDPATGLQTVVSLRTFWLTRSYVSEGRRWVERLLHSGAAAAPLHIDALGLAAALAYDQGDYEPAERLAQQSLELARTHDHHRAVAQNLLTLGLVAYGRSDYVQANTLLVDALLAFEAINDRDGTARARHSLALVAKDQGDYERARLLHTKNLALMQQIGNRQREGFTLLNLSIVEYWQGHYAQAAATAQQSADLLRALGNQTGRAYALEILGMVAYKQGDYTGAAILLNQGLKLFQEHQEKIGSAMVLHELGLVALAQHDQVQALEYLRRGLEVAWAIGERRRVAFCLEGMAAALISTQPVQATRLLSAATHLREMLGSPLPPSERAAYAATWADLQQHLDGQTWASAWAAGSTASLEQVVNEAMEQ